MVQTYGPKILNLGIHEMAEGYEKTRAEALARSCCVVPHGVPSVDSFSIEERLIYFYVFVYLHTILKCRSSATAMKSTFVSVSKRISIASIHFNV